MWYNDRVESRKQRSRLHRNDARHSGVYTTSRATVVSTKDLLSLLLLDREVILCKMPCRAFRWAAKSSASFALSPTLALHKKEVYSQRNGFDCTSHRKSPPGGCPVRYSPPPMGGRSVRVACIRLKHPGGVQPNALPQERIRFRPCSSKPALCTVRRATEINQSEGDYGS